MDFESDFKLLENISEGLDTIKKKFGRNPDLHGIPVVSKLITFIYLLLNSNVNFFSSQIT